jgi:outer membrane protein assembly factor BamA
VIVPPWKVFCIGLLVPVLLLTARPVAAEDGESTAAAAPQPLPTLDVGDLWRMALHKEPTTGDTSKKFVVFAPSIGSKPSTGLNGGVSGNIAFYLGDPATTRISTINGGLKVSQKGQTLGGIRFVTYSHDNRWFLQDENRLSWTSQNTYPLGGDSPASSAANVKYDLFRFYGTAYRTIRPRLFVGVGLNFSDHTNVRAGTDATARFDSSEYVAYSTQHGFSLDGQTSSGTNLGLIYDTRDNHINPQHGVLASATYRTFFNGFLGGDSTWQELYLDARTYKKLTPTARHKLAFWFLGDLVTGGTAPYFDLPATAAQERSARGYGEGRYRGERMLYGEMEYRGALTSSGLVGIVAFLNTTTMGSVEVNERLFENFAPGAGFGFRFLLNKRSRTNLCTDYGWGKAGSRGFYLSIQEAF